MPKPLSWKGQAPLYLSLLMYSYGDTRSRGDIIPSKDPTVATRPFIHLCDPTAVTLPLHSTPLEPTSTHETPAHFGTQYTFHRFLAILLAHLFCHHSFHLPT